MHFPLLFVNMNPNEDQTFFMWLTSNPLIDSAVSAAISQTVLIALLLATLLYLISLAYNYVKSVIDKLQGGDSDPNFVDIKDLIRTLVLFGCILMYPILIQPLVATINVFRFLSAPHNNIYMSFTEVGKKYVATRNNIDANLDDSAIADVLANPQNYDSTTVRFAQVENERRLAESPSSADADANADDGPTWAGRALRFAGDVLQYSVDPFFRAAVWGKAVVGVVSGTIKFIIGLLTQYIFKILLIVGPLAIAFSILPVFRGKLEEWFSTLLTMGFTFVTFNLLDILFYAHLSAVVDSSFFAGGNLNRFTVLAFDIALIICYIMVFWFTSKYVGKCDAGRFMTKFVGLATLGAMVLMSGGAAAPAAGGAAAMGGGVKGAAAAGAASDAFKNEG